MARKRKIIVYIAVSADGFIARRDGSVDWLDRPGSKDDYGMGVFYKSIDTILWGRKTCDMAIDFQKKDIPGAAFDTTVKNYVFTRSQPRSAAPAGVEFVNRPIKAFATRLRQEKRERHLDDGRQWHHRVVSRRRRDRRVHDSRDSNFYRRRHSLDGARTPHNSAKTDLLHEVQRRRGQSALCRF
jgi:hypothetical protein